MIGQHPAVLAAFQASIIIFTTTIGAVSAVSSPIDERRTDVAHASEPDEVVSVEGITEYRLLNGFRVLLLPDSSKQTITVNLTYLVGSRHENYGETGMAHLVEHMMFKSSTNHRHLNEEMTRHGAESNAVTWYDYTNYYETFQATDDNLTWALDLEADRMVHALLLKEDLESEITVVRNELEAGENDPTEVMTQHTLASAYLWHHYGKDVIGARSDIEKVPLERLHAFWNRFYQPDNAVLVVAGKLDASRTLALVVEKFGPMQPGRTLAPTYTVEPPQDGERSVTLRRNGDIQAVCLAYHIAAGAHPVKDALVSMNAEVSINEGATETTITIAATRISLPSVLKLIAEIVREPSLLRGVGAW